MIVLVMGVSGAGKSTIGPALARSLGWPYLDADDFHPPENVAKMASGTPLDDADRHPWLEKMNRALLDLDEKRSHAVLGCSALKEAYRQHLRRGVAKLEVVHLHAEFEVIRGRLAERRHRYMPASLLESQFATLEPPAAAIVVDVSQPVERCLAQILSRLEL